MKLTKLQRYTAYVIMLEELKDCKRGLCLVWMKLTGEKRWHLGDSHLGNILPELWRKAKNKDGGSWWDSKTDTAFFNERAAALKECIKETEPK